MRIRKGMKVRVIRGNHKGSEGKILFVFPKENKAIVEGVNFIKRAVRPTQNNPSGGYTEKEAAIHL
ncbi:MAG: 50S ribosomal protein L24, partial [Candidatus Neomarinimicrobiota bacterium]|nr:50S ribosomal protein L24 [Candidatus Neomarinimicrobiota bacterium]